MRSTLDPDHTNRLRAIPLPDVLLAAGAEAIREGELNVELPAKGGGEVGVLANAFGAMVEELREKEALEQLLVDLRAQGADTGGTTVGSPHPSPIPGDQRLPNAGEVFGGRYKIRAELGRGGMGVVYRASDLELEEDVALKVLKPGAFEDATDGLSKLKREIRIARRITHNISLGLSAETSQYRVGRDRYRTGPSGVNGDRSSGTQRSPTKSTALRPKSKPPR